MRERERDIIKSERERDLNKEPYNLERRYVVDLVEQFPTYQLPVHMSPASWDTAYLIEIHVSLFYMKNRFEFTREMSQPG